MSYQNISTGGQGLGLKRILILAVAVLFLIASLGLVSPATVNAATCSGSGCNGKDPVVTGCTASAYLAKQFPIRRVSDGTVVSGVYLQVYYSNTCGTNWVRVNKNPYCGKVVKVIDVAKVDGYHEVETDTTCGASYSMQVYAPGSTPVQVYAKLYDTAGRVKAGTDSYLVY